MAINQAVALAMLLSRLAPASAQQQQPTPPDVGVGRPHHCRDRCGNISVPYPFGIDYGGGCHRHGPGFFLGCNDTYNPPRLHIHGIPNQIEALSLDAGEARVYYKATRECYDARGKLDAGNATEGTVSFGTDDPWRFSADKNRLASFGCPNLGYWASAEAYYISGCMSVCQPKEDSIFSSSGSGPCTGVDCCQSTVPSGMNIFQPLLYNNFSRDRRFLNDYPSCHYVFLAEAQWLNTNYREYLRRVDDFTVPLVLDWAIRDAANCSAAESNTTDYACRSTNSRCVNSTNGPGYQCKCEVGFEGNPFLHDGCGDINECNHKDKYPCYGICTNTLGYYTCECPPGTTGDAYTQNGCRAQDRFTLALKVVTGVSVGVFLSAFTSFWLYLGLQKRKLIQTKQRFFQQNGGVLLQQQMRSYGSGAGGGFKLFSEEELKKATDNFATDRILGRGGHGIVYKGVLEDKATVVAIKKSKVMEAAQTKEFAKEMLILSQINHRNVVKLLGCCLEVEVPMLVYEFVPNGTLYHYIHNKNLNTNNITFDTRLRIAAESAEALAYMHSSASPPILHGDVKTANILLDDKLTAKVSDFGASKLAPTDEVEIATLVQGTCGYLDPEYLMTCQLTDKSDVYSFGVVLLELLTRKKALYFEGPEEDRSLVSCFMAAVKAGRYVELLDSQVRNEMRAEVLDEITHLVLQCVSMTGEERPTMKAVAERLEMLRRYQQHPWAQADDDLERQGLLGVEEKNLPYKFNSY